MNFQELMKKMSDLEQPVIEQDDTTESCGMMNSLPSPMSPPDQQDSVTMNVSMNGSGRGGIKDLLDVLRNIENGSPADIDDGPNMLVKKDTPDMPDELKAMGMALDDDFANEPDEMYQDQAAVVGTGNDLHSKGAEAPPVNGGGNPRSVKTGETFKLPSGNLKIKLESLYQEIKSR